MQGKRFPLMTFVLTLLAVALLAGRSVAAESRIAPGDNLSVTVVGEEDYSRSYKVSADGKITMPPAGDILVAGKTKAEAARDIQKRLTVYLKKPVVLLEVTQYVHVTGEVSRPDPIVAQPDARLSYYLKQAGVKESDADLDKGYLIRAGQKDPITLDLRAALTASDPSKDIEVKAGDTIYVPKKAIGKVKVFGEVSTPGEKDLTQNLTPLQVVTSLSGGFKPTADKSNVTIQHKDGTRVAVDLESESRGDDSPLTKNLFLQDGDVIFVPNNEDLKVSVSGAGVAKPDKYAFAPGMRVMDAIRSAGDFKDDANKEEVAIHHKSGESVTVNLDKYLREGDITQNVLLEKGDIVLVKTATNDTSQVEVSGLGVKTPGKVAYEPGMRVMNAIVAAGGLNDNPKLKQVSVMHKDGKANVVNLEKFLKDGDSTQNLALQKGDTIIVGQEKVSTGGNKRAWIEPLIGTITSALIWRSIYD